MNKHLTITLARKHEKYLDQVTKAVETARQLEGLSDLVITVNVGKSGTHVQGEGEAVELMSTLVGWTLRRAEDEQRRRDAAHGELLENLRTIGNYARLVWDDHHDYLRSNQKDTTHSEQYRRLWEDAWCDVYNLAFSGNYLRAREGLDKCEAHGTDHIAKVNDAMLFARLQLVKAKKARGES